MPSVYVFKGFTVFLWSNEGGEPVHVHVSRGDPGPNSAKFWILEDGSVELAVNAARLSKRDLRVIGSSLEEHADEIVARWEEHLGRPATYHGAGKQGR